MDLTSICGTERPFFTLPLDLDKVSRRSTRSVPRRRSCSRGRRLVPIIRPILQRSMDRIRRLSRLDVVRCFRHFEAASVGMNGRCAGACWERRAEGVARGGWVEGWKWGCGKVAAEVLLGTELSRNGGDEGGENEKEEGC